MGINRKRGSVSLLSRQIESILYMISTLPRPSKAMVAIALLQPRFSYNAVRTQITRLHKKGYINKIGHGKNAVISFLKRFEELIWPNKEVDRTKLSSKAWDKKWRLLIYDIPEKYRHKRDALRVFIAQLGFGKVQGSCWVSPYDLSLKLHEFCKKQKIVDYICIYEGKFFAGKDITDLCDGIWHLNKINDEYKSIIEMCQQCSRAMNSSANNDSEWFNLYYEAYSALTNALRNDPFLPDEFLENWSRVKAQETLSNLAAKAMIKVEATIKIG